ncbi:hypothetical protein BC937DRAFT_91439 [Endogone sp. FLAS-F59071]|nr:hypothetical protein BC937DRAFT_91439 [Endogone sp. FLAS-F59071]|eukprot:RUS21797.1 hypothetical protein BC937DRAFT_91439 [Endogone sp. FLAS-F59071]
MVTSTSKTTSRARRRGEIHVPGHVRPEWSYSTLRGRARGLLTHPLLLIGNRSYRRLSQRMRSRSCCSNRQRESAGRTRKRRGDWLD